MCTILPPASDLYSCVVIEDLPAEASLHALGQCLRAAQYTPTGLRALWGVDADSALHRSNAAPARWRLRTRIASGDESADARAVLAGLLLLDMPQDADAVRRLLGPAATDDLIRTGVLHAAGSEIAAGLALTPYAVPTGVPRGLRPGDDTLLLLSDHGTLVREEPVEGDFVLGLGGAGRTLAEITPRAQVDTAVDIGTGCGIQALLLARHAARVIATDTSARALWITALNARLNGVEGIELRQGSLFDPVPETVDLVVSNPPFVITPQGSTRTLEYRDGGMRGDAIMRTLLQHLRPGGHAALLGNWEYTAGSSAQTAGSSAQTTEAEPTTGAGATVRTSGAEDEAQNEAAQRSDAQRDEALAPPLHWLDPAEPVSLMVIERERLDPVSYAETWIRDGGVIRASSRWDADTHAWLTDFESRGVTAVGFGWIRMHRPGPEQQPEPRQQPAARLTQRPQTAARPRGLRHIEHLTGPLGANAMGTAAHLDLRLSMLEWLRTAPADELAATAFVRAADITEHRHFVPGADAPTMLTVEQGTGFGRTFASDPALSGFLGVADGTLSLQAVSRALADLLEVGEPELRAQLLEQLRVLIPAGVVYPAPSEE